MSGTAKTLPPGGRPDRGRMTETAPSGVGHRLVDLAIRGLIGGLMLLPYRWRVPLCGAVVARVVAPLAGYRRRIRENLALILPDLPAAEVRRIERAGRAGCEVRVSGVCLCQGHVIVHGKKSAQRCVRPGATKKVLRGLDGLDQFGRQAHLVEAIGQHGRGGRCPASASPETSLPTRPRHCHRRRFPPGR